jgi:hypothetical protein
MSINKKVCETESRSLSDVINEITNSHADQNLTSTSNGIKDDNDHSISSGQVKDKSKLDNIVIQEGDESSLQCFSQVILVQCLSICWIFYVQTSVFCMMN